MTDQPLLTPNAAIARFGIARSTLADWAAAGLIGKFKQGRTVRYVATDIADVLANGTTPRRVVSLPTATESVDDSWRDDELWRGTSAAAPRPHAGGRR